MVDGQDNAWRSRAPGPHAHGNTARQVMDGLWTEPHGQQKQSHDPGNIQHNLKYPNCWAPLTRKRHTMPHPAQPWHTNHWAPRTRKRHQQEHWPQRPKESNDPTQHAKGRTGDCPGPVKKQQPDGMSHRGMQRCEWFSWEDGTISGGGGGGKGQDHLGRSTGDFLRGGRPGLDPGARYLDCLGEALALVLAGVWILF